MRQDVGEKVRSSENRDFRKSQILAAYGRLEEVLEPQMLARRRPNWIQVTRRAALLLEE